MLNFNQTTCFVGYRCASLSKDHQAIITLNASKSKRRATVHDNRATVRTKMRRWVGAARAQIAQGEHPPGRREAAGKRNYRADLAPAGRQ